MSELYIVGIGPGDRDDMTIRADRALGACDVIVGYGVYVDLVRDIYPGKEYLSTPMTREADRCRMAIELARKGKKVALVCSGDSGIYGMAGLVYEIRGEDKTPEVIVIPGLTAACSGAALLGAPLTHDFAVISLSDRLTAWETIEKRLECAAEGGFSIVLYNPASHGRPEHLKRACKILLKHIPGDRPCGVAEKIGREGEKRSFFTLKELSETDSVNMFCTVFIGNESTKMIGGGMVTPRGYRDV